MRCGARLGVVTALYDRMRTNEGCKVSTSLYETGIFWSNYHLLSTKLTGQNPQKLGSNHGAFSPYGAFKTMDLPVMIGISNNSLFERLCKALQQEQWITDERFISNDVRVKNRFVLNERIETMTMQLTSDELIEKLEIAGIPAAKVKTMQDVLEDPQQQANDCIVKLPHERDGDVFVTRIPITLSHCDLTPTVAAPMYGEHTNVILNRLEQSK